MLKVSPVSWQERACLNAALTLGPLSWHPFRDAQWLWVTLIIFGISVDSWTQVTVQCHIHKGHDSGLKTG